jgi:hypothetical protein
MKHLEAGLIVGGILLGISLVATFAWWLLSLFVGAYAAAIILTFVVIVGLAVMVIDWKTEK